MVYINILIGFLCLATGYIVVNAGSSGLLQPSDNPSQPPHYPPSTPACCPAPDFGLCKVKPDYDVMLQLATLGCPKALHGSCFIRMIQCLAVAYPTLREKAALCDLNDTDPDYCKTGPSYGPSKLCCLTYNLGTTTEALAYDIVACMASVYPCCKKCEILLNVS